MECYLLQNQPQIREGRFVGQERTCAVAQNKIIVLDERGKLHVFDGDTMTWQEVKQIGQLPPNRASGRLCAIDRTTVILFGGGVDYPPQTMNEVFSLDVPTWRWTWIKQSGTVPVPKRNHSLSYIGNNKVLCVGGEETTFVNEVHIFDLNTNRWSKRYTKGDISPGREGHTATFVAPSSLIMFAGKGRKSSIPHNDLYILHVDTMVWKKVPTKGEIPPARHCHSGVLYNNTLLVVGGIGEGSSYFGQELEDSFQLNLSTFEWKKLSLQLPAKSRGLICAPIVNRSPKLLLSVGLMKNFVVPLGPKSLVELCFDCICKNYDMSMQNIDHVPPELKATLGLHLISYYYHCQISKLVCNQALVLELLLQ